MKVHGHDLGSELISILLIIEALLCSVILISAEHCPLPLHLNLCLLLLSDYFCLFLLISLIFNEVIEKFHDSNLLCDRVLSHVICREIQACFIIGLTRGSVNIRLDHADPDAVIDNQDEKAAKTEHGPHWDDLKLAVIEVEVLFTEVKEESSVEEGEAEGPEEGDVGD